MPPKYRWFAAPALIAVALLAFLTGRRVEEEALAARVRAHTRALTSPAPAIDSALSHRQLAVTEIIRLPFAAFYEALRSAPADARKKWATELEAMPEGPRRTAAICGFYKLLVQFDPAAAAKAIGESEDKRLQNLALACAVDAAPGLAMRTIAELALKPSAKGEGVTDRLWQVLSQWTVIDPAAAAQFLDEYGHEEYTLAYRSLISDWAALDPEAARKWLEKKGISEVPELRRCFIEGWYENDRAAAVSYVASGADDPGMRDTVGDVLRLLLYDSKDEARKFIESLPDDTTRHEAFRAAFENAILGEEQDTGEPQFSPRAAGDWMTQFPPPYWKGTLTQVFKWSQKKPQEMLAWVEQQPLAIREAVAAEYTAPFQMPVHEAILPVLQVADPVLRDQLLRGFFKNLDTILDDKARNAIASAPMSSEQKNHVFQIIADVEAEKNRD